MVKQRHPTPESATPLDIALLIDQSRLGAFQLGLFGLLGLTVIMDGFDVQAIGYVAPAIIRQWGVERAALGPVFAAGLLGLLLGALILSVVADRIGRRPVVIVATLFFAVCMLLTPQVHTLSQLELIRFVTGLGLGAIMPNAVALAREFSPQRRRTTLIMLVSCGFTVGAIIGGLLAAWMIPVWGWSSVFYVGGIIPLVLSALMLAFLPESLHFLLLSEGGRQRVRATLQRVWPSMAIDQADGFTIPEAAPTGSLITELFRDGRGRLTLLLWTVMFLNLIGLYFLSNWLPTIATGAGLTTSEAALIGTTLQVGGLMGTLALGPTIDRLGFFRVLVPVFLLAAVTVSLIGQPGMAPGTLVAVVLLAGFGIVGSQPALNALAADSYPTSLRSTGLGWSLGVGRIGSIVGPLAGGELIRLQWTNQHLFQALAVPALLSALVVAAMARLRHAST